MPDFKQILLNAEQKRRNKTVKTKFEVVGHITVDAGIVQLGDPCYQDADFRDHKKWAKYIETMGIIGMNDSVQIPHSHYEEGNYGKYGRAVVVVSGFGDGVYPVEIKKCSKTSRVKEVRIRFF
jgi:hypothetical protein